jgi:drug/metabolite transporter (DMT)-like permease
MKNDYLKGVAITLAGVVILSPDALFIKLTGELGAFENTLVRSLYMALAWAIMVRLWKGNLVRSLMAVSRIGLLAAFLLAIDRLFFIEAVRTTTVANMLAIFAAVPAFAALIAFVFFREKCDLVKCVAIGASMLGVAIIFAGDIESASLYGNTMAVLAALFYALYIVCMRFSTRDEVLESLCLSGLIAAAASLPFADLGTISLENVAIIGLQSALLLPVGFALFFSGTRYLPAAEVALIGLLETVLGPVWALMVIGEVPSQHALLGGAIVVLAVSGQAVHGLLRRRQEARLAKPPEPSGA